MNLYVGNFPKSVQSSELSDLFEQYGSVDDARVITDRFTGESRGFGFVDMPTKEEAEAAIEALNGKDFKGRTLTVNEARERRPHFGGGRSGGGRSGGGRSGGGYRDRDRDRDR
jgi:RNA recognition motif-containing protein